MLLPFVADVNHFIKDTIVVDGSKKPLVATMADVVAIWQM